MARTDNFNNFLTDVADSIRSKTGKTETIAPADFDTEIQSIKSNPNLQDKTVSFTFNETRTITPDSGYDGLNNVTVAVEIPEGRYKYTPQKISFMEFDGKDLSQELAELDGSKITDGSYMFSHCTSLESLDLTNITGALTKMERMFYGCQALRTLDLKPLNTVGNKSLEFTFYGCAQVVRFDFSNFYTDNVTSMKSLFYNCMAVTSLDLSKWNTSKVTNMGSMFYCCKKLKRLDLSNFDFGKTTDVSSLVASCSALEFLDIRTLTFDKVTSYRSMFAAVPSACLIIVKSDTERDFILSKVHSGMTNIKTVAEYETVE